MSNFLSLLLCRHCRLVASLDVNEESDWSVFLTVTVDVLFHSYLWFFGGFYSRLVPELGVGGAGILSWDDGKGPVQQYFGD